MAFDFGTLVTNRTQQDVDYVRQLIDKLLNGTATDAEKAEWNSFTLKGSYNYTDMNRVGDAVEYVALLLLKYGTSVDVFPKHDWSESDIPTVSQLEQYRSDIATLRDALDAMPTTPQVPATMNNLTLSEANAIEKILQDTGVLIFNMQAAWFYSNDIFAGEV